MPDGCWEQFVFVSTPAEAAVFIQYWLIGYQTSNDHCPLTGIPEGSDWMLFEGSCYANSAGLVLNYDDSAVPEPITKLSDLTFEGAVYVTGGNTVDQVSVTDGSVGPSGTTWTVTVPADVLDLAQNWQVTEFNVFGYGDGSRANFNPGVTIAVEAGFETGTSATIQPSCQLGGFTAETNNLNLRACSVTPSDDLSFKETNAVPPSVPVGDSPSGVAYDPSKREVFVANVGSNNVTVISDGNNSEVATVPVGSEPNSTVVDPSTHEVFVTNRGSNNVSVISDATNAVVATVEVGSSPSGVAYDSAKHEVFVTNTGSDNVSVICDGGASCGGAPMANKVVATVGVGAGPDAAAYDSSKQEMFVANLNSNDISVVCDGGFGCGGLSKANEVVATVPVGSGPDAVAFDPSKHEVFVANLESDNVSVISDVADTLAANVGVGVLPAGLAYDSSTHEVFVANYGSDNVSLVSDSANKVEATVSVANCPLGAAYDPAKDELFVADNCGSSVSVISRTTPSVVTTLPVGTDPTAVAYDSVKHETFVANAASDDVSVICDGSASCGGPPVANKVVQTVAVGSVPAAVAYDPSKDEVFVANQYSDNVSVVSDVTDTVVATVDVGSYPQDVTYDVGKHEVFVANSGSANVSVICDGSASCGGALKANKVVHTVAVGTSPAAVVYDPSKHEVFVANYGSNDVSVILDATNTVTATVGVGVGPYAEGYDPSSHEVFVTNRGSSNVSLISDVSDKVTATVPVGSGPDGAAYDPAAHEVFVTNLGSGNVSVISDVTEEVVATVMVGGQPAAATYDASQHEVFVANLASDTVSVISDRTPV